jgi:hypothetical protein
LANSTSTRDLKSGALHRCGELTDGTSDYDEKAIEYLNRLHLALLAGGSEFGLELGEPWAWAKNKYPGVINLEAPYSTGTITLVQDSDAGTFSTPPTESAQNWYLKVDGFPEYFRILSHLGSAPSFNLDGEFTEASGTYSYSILKVDYDLDIDILRLIGPMRVYRNQRLEGNEEGLINGTSGIAFARDWPLHRIQPGVPTVFTQIGKDTDSTVTVRFNRIVSETTRVEYDYISIPLDLTDSDISIPMVPREHRSALEFGATHYLMMDKNDPRAADYESKAKLAFEALIQANKKEMSHISLNKGKLFPRADQLRVNRRFLIQEVD